MNSTLQKVQLSNRKMCFKLKFCDHNLPLCVRHLTFMGGLFPFVLSTYLRIMLAPY